MLRGYDLLDTGVVAPTAAVDGTPGTGPGEIGSIGGVALNPGPGLLFITDTANDRLLAYPRYTDGSPNDPVAYADAIEVSDIGGIPIDNPGGIAFNTLTGGGYMTLDNGGFRGVIRFDGYPDGGAFDFINMATWPAGPEPGALAFDRTRNNLYIAVEGTGTIEMVSGDDIANTVRSLSGPTGNDYNSLSVDPNTNRLYGTKSNEVDVFSLATGTLLGSVQGFAFNGGNLGFAAVENWQNMFLATTETPQLADLFAYPNPICTPSPPITVRRGESVTFTPECTDFDDSTVREFEVTNSQTLGTAAPTVDLSQLTYTAGPAGGQDDIAYRVTTQDGWSVQKHQLINVPAAAAPSPSPDGQPVIRETTNLQLDSGDVYVKLPGSNEFVKLTKDMLVPIGTVIDAREGKARLTLANKDGSLYDGIFWDGIFQVIQGSGDKPVTTMKLRDDLVAKASGFATAASTAELERSLFAYTAKKRGRKKNGLWGDGKGKFKTSGKGGSAAVRGTRWYVANYANGTLFKVSRGSVTIDPIRGENFTLKAGKSFFIFYKR